MVKNKHKHFNPDEHEVNVKMAKVKKSSHCKHNINYHIVFIPKNSEGKETQKELNSEGIFPPKPKVMGIQNAKII